MDVQYQLIIKSIKLFRIIVWSWRNMKYERIYRAYLNSEASKGIKSFKAQYAGERCIIIGNEPSLKAEDLEKRKGEYTFAANRIYEIFPYTSWRPWAYLVVDTEFLKEERETIHRISCIWRFLASDVGASVDDVNDKIIALLFAPHSTLRIESEAA